MSCNREVIRLISGLLPLQEFLLNFQINDAHPVMQDAFHAYLQASLEKDNGEVTLEDVARLMVENARSKNDK